MSGSYDRPGRPPSAPRTPYDYDPYDDVVTGPATGPSGAPPLPPHAYETYADEPQTLRDALPRQGVQPPRRPQSDADRGAEMYAPSRPARKSTEQTKAPIVPAGSVTGRSLTLVITIMCFLACLTAGAVYMVNESAEAWLKDIASEVTVQIEPQDGVDTEKTITEVVAYLQSQPGIAKVKPLSVETSSELLQPWLGKLDALKTLPLPRLVAIEIDRSSPANMASVSSGLEQQFKGATLDDHRRWQRQIRTVTRSMALGGLAILLLMAAATTAIIVSATKSSLASNREIVEVLHFVGATDRFIAHEFEKHFLRLGIRAGLVGAILALGVFLLMPVLLELLGGGAVTAAEMHRLVGTGSLDMAGYVLLGIVVVVIAALCMLTSRFGVYRILNSRG